MKIVLSPISESDDDIRKFMEEVDADVSRLPSNDTVWSTVSTVGQVLQLTKNIMDNVSKVRHYCFCRICSHGKSVIIVPRYIRYSTHRGPLFPDFIR